MKTEANWLQNNVDWYRNRVIIHPEGFEKEGFHLKGLKSKVQENIRMFIRARVTDANGNFSLTETNSQGVNTYNFLVIDPFGRQLIRSYPVFWIPYAAPGSKLN